MAIGSTVVRATAPTVSPVNDWLAPSAFPRSMALAPANFAMYSIYSQTFIDSFISSLGLSVAALDDDGTSPR